MLGAIASKIALWIGTKLAETALGEIFVEILERKFPRLFKNKTKEIVEIYENRIEKKNEEIKSLEREQLEQNQQHELEERHLIQSLKRRSIAIEKLIEKYHKPLNSILISYASQHEKVEENRTRRVPFIKEELKRYGAKYLGGTVSLIPPKHIPDDLQTREDLKTWFETEILKGRYCKLKFLVLFDLKKNAFWGTYLPYTQINPTHHNIGEVLDIEDVFTKEQIDRLSISEIINSGDIAWLASSVVSEDELSVILRNQKKIEKSLGNPSLRILSGKSIEEKLSGVLSEYIENSNNVASAITEEASFWYDKIRE